MRPLTLPKRTTMSFTLAEYYAINLALSCWLEDRTEDEKSQIDTGERAQIKVRHAITLLAGK